MPKRRDFGALRRLPSGRWQVRYRSPRGPQTAPNTFATRAEAGRYLSALEADLARGAWRDPRAGDVEFHSYARAWLGQRTDLRPRTCELYEGLLRLHLLPAFDRVSIGRISTASVRQWHAERIHAGIGQSTVAKAYRLLKTIMATAVADELIHRNPCVLRGAGVEHPAPRVIPTLSQVDLLADAIEPRWRMLVLLAAWSGLRWGEIVGLTRQRVDCQHGQLHVVEQLVETSQGIALGPPKTDAGRRVVIIPPHLVPELEDHLSRFVGVLATDWVFCGPRGAPLRRRNFARRWSCARIAAGLPQLHFHDLRHLAATLAATTGATTKELMSRMGHSSPRAALIYQHASQERDRVIASALSEIAAGVAPRSKK